MSILKFQISRQSANRKLNSGTERSFIFREEFVPFFSFLFFIFIFFLTISEFPLSIHFCIPELKNLASYTGRHKHSQSSILYVWNDLHWYSLRPQLLDPDAVNLVCKTRNWLYLIKHRNYKKSDLQYICYLDSQDFSESCLAHLGTCDTFIAGTCSLKALAASLLVDSKCLL